MPPSSQGERGAEPSRATPPPNLLRLAPPPLSPCLDARTFAGLGLPRLPLLAPLPSSPPRPNSPSTRSARTHRPSQPPAPVPLHCLVSVSGRRQRAPPSELVPERGQLRRPRRLCACPTASFRPRGPLLVAPLCSRGQGRHGRALRPRPCRPRALLPPRVPRRRRSSSTAGAQPSSNPVQIRVASAALPVPVGVDLHRRPRANPRCLCQPCAAACIRQGHLQIFAKYNYRRHVHL